MSDFSLIIDDNERAVRAALDRGDNIQAFLLVHSLVESLLRIFLGEHRKDLTFSNLIKSYENFLEEHGSGVSTFVEELTQFNRRRNRIVHELWRKGCTYTNHEAKDAATTAIIMYGLFIEFLQTYDPELSNKGFKYDEGS